MFQILSFRSAALAACALLAAAAPAAALTLGRASGAVLIGRPLELAIPATLDAADGDAPCLEGELFHGETRVARAPGVRWEAREGGQGTVRVTSPVPVDEPMITLYLRVGCAQKMTRRYVLLAELPPPGEAAPAPPAAAATAPPRLAPPRAATPPAARRPEAAPTARPATGQPPAPAPAPAAAAPRREPAPRAARAPQAREPALRASPRLPSAGDRPAAGRPRLQLEPIELAAERDPALRLSPELLSQPVADAQARQAAAALWQALRKSPDEAVQEGLRVQTLEREIATLRDATRQNAQAVSLMREQAEKARRERNDVTLLGGVLLALLLLAAAGLAWAWRRKARERSEAAWYEAEGQPAPPEPAAPVGPAVPPTAKWRNLWPRRSEAPAGGEPAPVAGRTAPGALAAQAAQPPRTVAGTDSRQDFQPSHNASLRTVRVDELIDIQDKADFFLSIGQHQQAIAVLESHVHDQVETSPLPWLDLLDLYHELGRRDDYARTRAEFRQHFAAAVPDFDHFRQTGGGLENYGRALSRIVALWPSRRVLEVIEESIFRKPGTSVADSFSLEAYRELILLFNIAREVAPQEEAEAVAAARFGPSTTFPATDMQSLAALDRPELVEPDRERLMMPPASPRLGLDIDLSESDEAPAPGPAASPAPSPTPAPDMLAPDLYLDFDTAGGETVDPADKGRRDS